MSKTLEKGVYILSLFTYERPTWRLDEMAQATKIPKPTLLRFLKTFTDVGFLRRPNELVGNKMVPGDHYFLGPKLIELGAVSANSIEIRSMALPYMAALRDKFKLAVQLIYMDGLEGLYIEKVESQNPVLLYTKIGRRAPLYAGACSRIIFAFQDEEKVNAVLQQKRIKFASGTPQDEAQIKAQITNSKLTGYAYSVSELEEGTVALAVPIFNADNNVQYSISMAGIEATIPKDKVPILLQEMWQAAAKLSQDLGYSHPYPYGE